MLCLVSGSNCRPTGGVTMTRRRTYRPKGIDQELVEVDLYSKDKGTIKNSLWIYLFKKIYLHKYLY